jgi:hypothetical protein
MAEFKLSASLAGHEDDVSSLPSTTTLATATATEAIYS